MMGLDFATVTRERKQRLMRFLGVLDRVLNFSAHLDRVKKRYTVELEMMDSYSVTDLQNLLFGIVIDGKPWADALLHELRPDLDNEDRKRRMWEAYGKILPKFPWEPDEKAVVPEESENLGKIVGKYMADEESKIGEIPAQKKKRFRNIMDDPFSIGVPLPPEDVFAIKAKADAEGDFVAAVVRRYLFAGLSAVSSQKVVLKPCRGKRSLWLTVRIPHAKLFELNAARKELRFRSRPQLFGALVHFALKQEAQK